MLGTRVDRCYVRVIEPLFDHVNCHCWHHRIRKRTTIGYDPDKPADYDRRQPHSFSSIDEFLPPILGSKVLRI